MNKELDQMIAVIKTCLLSSGKIKNCYWIFQLQ